MRRRDVSLVLLSCLCCPLFLRSQAPFAERADAEARIFIIRELSLTRVQDLDFGILIAGEPLAQVEARTSPSAGKFVLEFDDTQEWTVGYHASEQLEPVDAVPGAASLPFEPEIFGNPNDMPAGSFPIEPETEVYRTEGGTFYFWVGGEIDAADALPGTYSGVVTLTVEPL